MLPRGASTKQIIKQLWIARGILGFLKLFHRRNVFFNRITMYNNMSSRRKKNIETKNSILNKLKPDNKIKYFLWTIFLIILCVLILWYTAVISICGDNRCDSKECSFCKADCSANTCTNGVCDLAIGENCQNSKDCFCQSGYTCQLSRSNLDEKGCYKTVCGDSLCDRPDEIESNCCIDCGCLQGYTCDKNTNKCLLEGPSISVSGLQQYQPSATILYTNPDLYWGSPISSHPFFTVTISNSGGTKARNVKIGTKIGIYSDWEYKTTSDLDPSRTSSIPINVHPTSTILGIKQPTMLTASILVSYDDIEGNSYNKNFSLTLNIYGREYIDWSHPEFVAGWITDKDPKIREFATMATKGLAPGSNSNDIITAAKRIWDQLSAYGVRYVSDPSGMEYASFPAETLKIKSGDCEDLAILYASLLKSIGIKTNIILIPEHAFITFNTGSGIAAVETTMIGSDFSVATAQGTNTYNSNLQSLKSVSVESSYISPPTSINVGDLPIPDISLKNSEWSFISQECSASFFVCFQYRCRGKCTFSFQNSGGGTGRKCGTFMVLATSSTYLVKEYRCADISDTYNVEMEASWLDSNADCRSYSPTCRFTEE